MGCLSPSSSCNNIVPIPSLQASVCNTDTFSKSGSLKIGGLANRGLGFRKCNCLCSLTHLSRDLAEIGACAVAAYAFSTVTTEDIITQEWMSVISSNLVAGWSRDPPRMTTVQG